MRNKIVFIIFIIVITFIVFSLLLVSGKKENKISRPVVRVTPAVFQKDDWQAIDLSPFASSVSYPPDYTYMNMTLSNPNNKLAVIFSPRDNKDRGISLRIFERGNAKSKEEWLKVHSTAKLKKDLAKSETNRYILFGLETKNSGQADNRTYNNVIMNTGSFNWSGLFFLQGNYAYLVTYNDPGLKENFQGMISKIRI